MTTQHVSVKRGDRNKARHPPNPRPELIQPPQWFAVQDMRVRVLRHRQFPVASDLRDQCGVDAGLHQHGDVPVAELVWRASLHFGAFRGSRHRPTERVLVELREHWGVHVAQLDGGEVDGVQVFGPQADKGDGAAATCPSFRPGPGDTNQFEHPAVGERVTPTGEQP